MSVPTHKSSCLTRAFSTKCRYCGEEVFYFFCTCGTKLLFESLGPPWPIHNCMSEVEDIIDEIKNAYGTVDQAVINRLKILSEERGAEIDEKTLNRIKDYLRNTSSKSVKKLIEPIDTNILVIGIIKTINHNVNFLKKYNIQNTLIGKKLLGDYGDETYSLIGLYTLPNQDNIIEEYEIILPESITRKLVLRESNKIAVKLFLDRIAAVNKIWAVEFIEKIK